MLLAYPPLEAYRRDVARLGGKGTFGANDGRWVAATILLERYGDAAQDERSGLATELAKYLALESELTFWSAGLQLATDIEEAGALNLAYSWLAFLERIVPEDRVVDGGRVLAQRARLARKAGDVEFSQELYAQVERLGEVRGEPELTARAWVGFAVIALERGNYPEARRWFQAAALVADDTACADPSSQAHQGLMIALAMAGDFDAAIVEGWQAFRSAGGDSNREAEILANVSQALHDMGHHEAAIRGFAAVVARTSQARVLLPALGGVAMAAAALGRRRAVHAVADRVERLAVNTWPHPTAGAWLDLADAFDTLGNADVAEQYRSRALAIAEAHSLHHLVHRATEARPAPAGATVPVQLGSAASRVVDDIASLDAPTDLCAVG